jgi:hypothetical protein
MMEPLYTTLDLKAFLTSIQKLLEYRRVLCMDISKNDFINKFKHPQQMHSHRQQTLTTGVDPQRRHYPTRGAEPNVLKSAFQACLTETVANSGIVDVNEESSSESIEIANDNEKRGRGRGRGRGRERGHGRGRVGHGGRVGIKRVRANNSAGNNGGVNSSSSEESDSNSSSDGHAVPARGRGRGRGRSIINLFSPGVKPSSSHIKQLLPSLIDLSSTNIVNEKSSTSIVKEPHVPVVPPSSVASKSLSPVSYLK